MLFEGALANVSKQAATKVDFGNSRRAPLLFLAGGLDHVSPPSLVRANVAKYADSGAVTDYEESADRTHFTLGQDGWEVVADRALEWGARPRVLDTGDRGGRRAGSTVDLMLDGKVAVVTGASKGIGLAVTRALAGEGAS